MLGNNVVPGWLIQMEKLARDAFLKGFDSGWDAADGNNTEIGKGDWLELRLAAWEAFKAEKGIKFA